MTRLALLGTGLIGSFYADALHGHRRRDRIEVVYSRDRDRAAKFAEKYGVERSTSDMHVAITDPNIDAVIIALPNDMHADAVTMAAAAGKAVLCTKPLGRTAAEAIAMLHAVESAGVFHGYLEDLVYTPKTLKSLTATRSGKLGDILWVRSRETHPGPHSDWFWDGNRSGGGAIIDMGCHCIEIARSFIGKDIRPVEVVCWGDTQVHPVDVEDHAVGMVRYENGAIGQFEVSWCFRGGMDLRDEISGTGGTLWLNHWLRTGMEMFTAEGGDDYVAEKSESDRGWLFPVGDEVAALGYPEMFTDMLDAMDAGRPPNETFYDGYVVNAIIDAAYQSIRSKRWEPIDLPHWRGRTDVPRLGTRVDDRTDERLIKTERLPDGRTKQILRNLQSGEIREQFLE